MRVPKGEILVDLGAGYCRGSLLSSALGLATCVSYEFVPERTKQAVHFLGENENIKTLNLLTAKIKEAYGYFLYFPRGRVLDIILKKLYDISLKREVHLFVCESHGDVLEYLYSLGLFIQKEEFRAALPRHYKNIVQFKFIKQNFDLIDWRQNLALWMLFKKEKNQIFLINYYSHNVKSNVKWVVPISSLSWVKYLGKGCLLQKGGRIIDIHGDEKIDSLGLMDKKLDFLLRKNPQKKLFIHNKTYLKEE